MYCHCTVSMAAMTFNGKATPKKASGTVIDLISCDDAALQACSHCEGLDGGARLIGIGNAVIFPQIIQIQILLFLCHGLDHCLIDHRVRLVDHRVSVCVGGLLHHKTTDHGRGILDIVQIIDRVAGHGQDSSRIHLHNNSPQVFRAVSFPNLIGKLVIKLL